ncbi:MAG: thioredoxin family protein [Cytophagales bacterium]|nr:thioredoxin family protein [Cytophagales bacterium]
MKNLNILVASLALLVFFAGRPTGSGYEVGDKVKDFSLKSVDGKMVSLADYKTAKGFIVIFDCNTCPFSKAYLNRIKALNDKYADNGFPVIAINSNDSKRSPGDSYKEMVKYAKKNDYQHPYLYDEDQSVATLFGATNTPHVYVLKKTGNEMVVDYIGAIDNNTKDADAADKKYVEDAVDALLKGQKPGVTKTKAIGCTIKWKEA